MDEKWLSLTGNSAWVMFFLIWTIVRSLSKVRQSISKLTLPYLTLPGIHVGLTVKWEVAGIMFLSTETKEKVNKGAKFFKASLPKKDQRWYNEVYILH